MGSVCVYNSYIFNFFQIEYLRKKPGKIFKEMKNCVARLPIR